MKRVSTEAALDRAEMSLGHARVSNGRYRLPECPACGPTSSRAFWLGDDGDGYALAGCFRCGLHTKGALELLGLLDGHDHGPRPGWEPPPRVPSPEERRCKVQERLAAALASPRIDAALAHARRHLLWSPALMRQLRTGENYGRVVLSVWADDNQIVGVNEYAMPNSLARVRIDRRGGQKLIAHGPRSLWPRPSDVADGPHLPGCLLLVEGAPAAATGLGCGLAAISYPSASGISNSDADRVVRDGRRIIVVGDCDPQGRAGMDSSVVRLRALGADAVGIDLEPKRADGFDVSDWLRETNNDNPSAAGERLAAELRGAM